MVNLNADLGIPQVATCAHAVPVFGCAGCIATERQNTLDAFKQTNPVPACPECRGKMVLYDSDPRTMTVFYLCAAGHDDEGTPSCEGEFEVRVR